MIGSDQIDIDGCDADGGRVPVMRKGEWAWARLFLLSMSGSHRRAVSRVSTR
jgi:hypothetical protein